MSDWISKLTENFFRPHHTQEKSFKLVGQVSGLHEANYGCLIRFPIVYSTYCSKLFSTIFTCRHAKSRLTLFELLRASEGTKTVVEGYGLRDLWLIY